MQELRVPRLGKRRLKFLPWEKGESLAPASFLGFPLMFLDIFFDKLTQDFRMKLLLLLTDFNEFFIVFWVEMESQADSLRV